MAADPRTPDVTIWRCRTCGATWQQEAITSQWLCDDFTSLMVECSEKCHNHPESSCDKFTVTTTREHGFALRHKQGDGFAAKFGIIGGLYCRPIQEAIVFDSASAADLVKQKYGEVFEIVPLTRTVTVEIGEAIQ
jgi:hypothetical protein